MQKKNVIKSECTAIGMQMWVSTLKYHSQLCCVIWDLRSWCLSMWFLCFIKIMKKNSFEKRTWDTEKPEEPLYLIFLLFMYQQCNHRHVSSSTKYWILKNPSSHTHFLGPLQQRVALIHGGEICLLSWWS